MAPQLCYRDSEIKDFVTEITYIVQKHLLIATRQFSVQACMTIFVGGSFYEQHVKCFLFFKMNLNGFSEALM